MPLNTVNSSMNNKFDNVFFDLDGTLVNTLSDLTFALNKMRAHFKLKPINDQTTANIIGKGFPTTTKKILALDLSEDEVQQYSQQALNLTLKHYENAMGKHSHIYDGVIVLLQKLKYLNIKMAVVTNKEYKHAIKTLQQLDLIHYFDAVIGGDSTEFYKPHPQPLQQALKLLNVSTENSIMIGDSENDLLCAHALKMPCVIIGHGYHNGKDLKSLNPYAYINHFDELFAFLQPD